MKSPRTYVHPDIQTDRQTDGNFFCSFCLLTYTKHEHSSKGENFFFTHAITIFSLFTYSVCDEKVKNETVIFQYITNHGLYMYVDVMEKCRNEYTAVKV